MANFSKKENLPEFEIRFVGDLMQEVACLGSFEVMRCSCGAGSARMIGNSESVRLQKFVPRSGETQIKRFSEQCIE